jgi:serine/threonine protein kinase
MTPARFQTIEEIFLAALEQEPDQISAFLDTACDGDAVLRHEVEALLASDQRAGRFIERSTVGLATKIIENRQAKSLVGQTIGHYKISERIGAGGMGEVYLATDITAGRKAALKLLPTRFTGDTERLKRFQQEARAVVALNHPNVLTVYEIGEDHSNHYIASELIEGETLRHRLMRGRTQLSEAVDIAIQVASALAAAHQAGIVHRDIKPANVMLRPDGYVKVLDFGIAKLAEQEIPVTTPRDEALLLVETNLGSILGTVRYMSPEQACGAHVDKTTDIWSLGVVLYEIVTGHAPFTGDTPKEVMCAILETEPPPLASYVAPTPAELQQIIGKTLRKDRKERYQSARELLEALKNLRRKLEFEAELERSAATRSWFGRRIPLRYKLTAVIALVVCALIGAIFLKSAPDARALFQQARILAAHSSSHLEGRQNNPRVIKLLEKVVKADPKFADAHAELAMAYIIRLFLYAPREKELEQKAYLEVERALSLNPNLASAYLARGRLKWTPFHHFPHEDAINDFKRAIALDPDLDEAHHYLGLVLLHIGLLEEARTEFQTAVRLNPSNNGAQFRLGETLFFEGRFREARNVFEGIDADFNPDLREYQLSVSLLALGQVAEAEKGLRNYLENHPEDRGGLLASVEAMIFAAGSQPKEAEERIHAAQAKRGFGHFHHTEYNIACAYALMNNTNLAVEWFERAVNDGFNCYPMFKNDPNLDRLRNDTRFQRIMEAERLRWENYRVKFGTQTPLWGESIAVLPLEELSEDKDNAFFADGIRDELFSNLCKIKKLKVTSRTSVIMSFAITPALLRLNPICDKIRNDPRFQRWAAEKAR